MPSASVSVSSRRKNKRHAKTKKSTLFIKDIAMFATNSMDAMNMMTVPDTCNTLVPSPIPVPTPLPMLNIVESSSHIPSVFNVMFGSGLAENLLTEGTTSEGDELGYLGGLVSGVFIDADMYVLGSFKVMAGVCFAARLTSMVGMNGMPFNTIGLEITPAQAVVSILS
jgi:hypothetical protein